jgi:predicted DNA-binding WGR domain protein
MKPEDQWTNPPDDFTFVLFDKMDANSNAQRYYLLGWMPTLFDDGAVVMCWGRKGVSQCVRVINYPSLQAAWPALRAVIRARIRHGYRVVPADSESRT